MRRHQKIKPIAIAASLAFSATAAMAATTPYDLIRPTWPLSWDAKVFENFDTTVTKKHGVLNIPATPESFKAGALMPDTLDQAYFDAINSKISPIRVNQAGYLKSDTERQFYYVGTAKEFEVVDENGKSFSTKVTGTFTATEATTQSDWTIKAGTDAATTDTKRYQVNITGPAGTIFVGKIPQSVPTNTRLRIKVGDEISSTFIVSDDVYTMVKDAALKFFGIQRSGNSESWFHGPSHTKDGGGKVVVIENYKSVAAEGYTSKEGALQGGWYDCGDHLKESQTQAYAFAVLAVMSATNPSKDVDHYAYNQGEFVKTDGIPDVLREAKHGADFFLKAYEFAKGVIDDMPVSVGNFGADHYWWGRPEAQDYLTNVEYRGGPADRDVRLGELGSTVSAEIAAGLAILGKDYATYDKKYADSCLMVAEKLYDFAKSLTQGKAFKNNTSAIVNTEAYNGNTSYIDKMGLASVALLYATGKKDYADDMIRATDLLKNQQTRVFAGGWFTGNLGSMLKGANTDWAFVHTYAIYALYKLILADKTKATAEYGLTEEERLAAIEGCLASMIENLGDVSSGTGSITLPATTYMLGSSVQYDPTWYSMQTDQVWLHNRYQMGNIFDVLAYADVAADIEKQGIKLPTMASSELKASEMRQLGINQLNYMFGVNPWDISFVYGIGDKNDAHPHHRAANPEGKNSPGLNYKYNCPVGGLLGGAQPSATNSWVPDTLSWLDFKFSETCLDASATLLSALTLVSKGGSDYYEKKCDNCKSGEVSPFSGEVYAAAYHYTFGDMDYFNINLFNETLEDADSVVAYIYFEATEEEMEGCGAIFTLDICQAYDMAGFNKPCENDREITTALRNQLPLKIEDTYNKDKKTYTWQQAIYLGTVGYGRRMRLDIGVTTGLAATGHCDATMQPSKVNVAGGWSFTAHTATKDAPAYAGAPDWDKDQGDLQQAPQDPYIVLRSKGKLLWGYGPGKTTDDRVVGIVRVAQKPNAQMLLNRGTLFVQTAAQGTKTLKVFDMLGNQLLAQAFDGTSAEVSLANIARRGPMIIRLTAGNKLLATKAIRIR